MNVHTAHAEANAQVDTVPDRWYWFDDEGRINYGATPECDPSALPAEVPTDADRRRARLDAKLVRTPIWSGIDCYDCGMRLSRPIHGHCFE